MSAIATAHGEMRRQHGVIDRKQARDAGLTDHQIDGRLRRGEWVPVHRGVYRYAGTALTWRMRVAAATMAGNAVASHRCAAALWGLELFTRPSVEITVEQSRRAPRFDRVVVHRSTQWALIDQTARHGIPTSGIDRTIIDCASIAGDDATERLAESAIRQQLTSWHKIEAAFELHAKRGRDGTARLRRLLGRRLGDPVVARSDFGRSFEQRLRAAGLPPARLEFPIHDYDGQHLLLGDLVWPERMRIVELDGLAHHFSRADRERDIAKRAEVRARGWRLLEIGWKLAHDDPPHAVALVARFLETP